MYTRGSISPPPPERDQRDHAHVRTQEWCKLVRIFFRVTLWRANKRCLVSNDVVSPYFPTDKMNLLSQFVPSSFFSCFFLVTIRRFTWLLFISPMTLNRIFFFMDAPVYHCTTVWECTSVWEGTRGWVGAFRFYYDRLELPHA